MSEYKRIYQSGRYYFFTLVTHLRCPLFACTENVARFKTAMNKVKINYPFTLNAIVVLPDHIHCLWRLPENDCDFSTRWRLIKRYFSLAIEVPVNHRGEKAIWQKRFWEHVIRDGEDWRAHMDYIHYNPVKHGLVKSPKDWQQSSFHYYVEKGFYENSWGVISPPSTAKINNVE